MKIISIDVGIRNLAICLLEIDDKKQFKITEWCVVNCVMIVFQNVAVS